MKDETEIKYLKLFEEYEKGYSLKQVAERMFVAQSIVGAAFAYLKKKYKANHLTHLSIILNEKMDSTRN